MVVMQQCHHSDLNRNSTDPWIQESDLVNGYVKMIESLHEAGVKVTVIRDVPFAALSVPDCVRSNGASSPLCQVGQGGLENTADPLVLAAVRISDTNVVDLDSYFCRAQKRTGSGQCACLS